MSFLSSISAMAAVCWKNAKTAGGSAEAANGTARGADVTVISLLLNSAPAEMNENVVERRSRPDAGLQIGGGFHRGGVCPGRWGGGVAKIVGRRPALGGGRKSPLVKCAR